MVRAAELGRGQPQAGHLGEHPRRREHGPPAGDLADAPRDGGGRDAGQEVGIVEPAIGEQVVHRDFHQHDDVLPLHRRLLDELRRGAVEHVDIDVRDGPKTATFDEDGHFVEHLGGLEDVALGPEHDGVGEAAVDEVERHQPVVDLGERRAAEPEHVDLDPVGGEVVEEGRDELAWILVIVARAVDEVHADNAEGLLRPEMYSTARIQIGTGMASVVPKSALVKERGSYYVIVQSDAKHFKRVQVQGKDTGADGSFAVTAGLDASSQVVVRGAALLNEMIVKAGA